MKNTTPGTLAIFIGIFLSSLGALARELPQCADLDHCPDAFTEIESSAGICSGVLISSDTVLTNRHCLPEEIQSAERSCDGKMSFRFPITRSSSGEEVGCEKVISLSVSQAKNELDVDFAFIKMKHPLRRKPAKYSNTGISDHQNYEIFGVTNESHHGWIKSLNCKSIQNSILNPFFNSKDSAVVFFSPCDVSKGFSGGLISSVDGTIYGIISNFSVQQPTANLNSSKAIPAAFGSNLSCVTFPGSAHNVESCNEDRSKARKQVLVKEMTQRLASQLNSELQKKCKELRKSSDPNFLIPKLIVSQSVSDEFLLTSKILEEKEMQPVSASPCH